MTRLRTTQGMTVVELIVVMAIVVGREWVSLMPPTLGTPGGVADPASTRPACRVSPTVWPHSLG